MTRPRTVSVVIPVKDDAEQLERCLRSLAAQTRPADEIVVVDNGSSDDSRAVAERHGARIVTELRPGIPAASAAGFDAASGRIIARCDADTRAPATWIADLVDALERADAVTGPGRLRRAPHWWSVVYDLAYLLVCTPALGHPPLFGSNYAMTAQAWRSISGDVHRGDADLHDDLDVSFHLGLRHRIARHQHLMVSISARPFDDAASFRHRLWRGWRSVVTHWPEQFPPVRWAQLALLRAARWKRG